MLPSNWGGGWGHHCSSIVAEGPLDSTGPEGSGKGWDTGDAHPRSGLLVFPVEEPLLICIRLKDAENQFISNGSDVVLRNSILWVERNFWLVLLLSDYVSGSWFSAC